ncbi:MAG: hypothetical protein IT291_06575 [Deltaproteobacteria bacterium]|nr:hypothetical protein [Deltaproteobacteria bacterium]
MTHNIPDIKSLAPATSPIELFEVLTIEKAPSKRLSPNKSHNLLCTTPVQRAISSFLKKIQRSLASDINIQIALSIHSNYATHIFRCGDSVSSASSFLLVRLSLFQEPLLLVLPIPLAHHLAALLLTTAPHLAEINDITAEAAMCFILAKVIAESDILQHQHLLIDSSAIAHVNDIESTSENLTEHLFLSINAIIDGSKQYTIDIGLPPTVIARIAAATSSNCKHDVYLELLSKLLATNTLFKDNEQ